MCNVTSRRISTGSMCMTPRAVVVREVKRRCLGRQNCAFEQHDLERMFPEDPCPGALKRLTVIGVCTKSQISLSNQNDFVDESHFGAVTMETRRLNTNAPATSGATAYMMRVQFQSSTKYLRTTTEENATGVVWGMEARKNGHAQKIHRLMAKFIVPDFMGANGTHFWLFKVTGRKYWARGE